MGKGKGTCPKGKVPVKRLFSAAHPAACAAGKTAAACARASAEAAEAAGTAK